jgi:hypothetical protein
MFSTSEYDYIYGLTSNYFDKGYRHYLCITNNPITNNTYNTPDVYCYYSKSNLSISNNVLTVPNNSIYCAFDSNNYSTNNNIDKLDCVSFSGSTSLSSKEFIYSDLSGYADIMSNYRFNYNLNFISISILCVLILLFLYKFTSNIFRR